MQYLRGKNYVQRNYTLREQVGQDRKKKRIEAIAKITRTTRFRNLRSVSRSDTDAFLFGATRLENFLRMEDNIFFEPKVNK